MDSEEPGDVPRTQEGSQPARAKLVCSVRLLLAFVCSIATFNTSYGRIGLSMALICMTHPEPKPSQKETVAKVWEFHWSSSTMGLLMSAAFYGFIVGPMLSGYLCFKYGGKIVLVVGTICSGVTYYLVPEGARLSPIVFCVIRVFTGLFSSLTFPAFYDLFSHWAVPEERQLLIGGALLGIPLASILNFPLNTFICQEWGWIWIFYIFGTWIVLCGISFIFTTYNYPHQCPYITVKELDFLRAHIPQTTSLVIPWKDIMCSMPVYAYIVMHFCMNYVYLSIIMTLPMFMDDVFHMSMKENGVLSATPFIGSLMMRILISLFFEQLRQKWKLSKDKMRKIFTSVGVVIVTACLLTATFLSSAYRYWALGCFIVASTSLELCITGGYLLSLLDICPSYVNVVTGLANSIGNTAGLICPVIMGWITIHGIRDEWNIVYYVIIAILLSSTVFYLIFGQNKLQSWGLAPLVVTQPLPRTSIVN